MTRTRRTNSPLKTTFLLALLVGAGYLAYEYLYVQRVLAGSSGPASVSAEERNAIRDAVLKGYGKDSCFSELGAMSYRAKEDHWRIDVLVEDGCFEQAQALCRGIAEMLEEDFRLEVSVWAYDGAGHEIAHVTP